jgi:hypothetical protein
VPSPTTTIPSILSIPFSEKLTKTNYPLWCAQVLSTIRAAQLDGLLTGAETAPEQYLTVTRADKMVSKEPNPAYASWVARDQAILGYVLSSLTRETLMHVSRCSTLAHVWSTLVDLYSPQT